MSISGIGNIGGIGGIGGIISQPLTSGVKPAGESFGKLLGDAAEKLTQLDSDANNATSALAAGQPVELHEVMVAMERASIGFQLALQVRNKLVEAYQEVMRTPV